MEVRDTKKSEIFQTLNFSIVLRIIGGNNYSQTVTRESAEMCISVNKSTAATLMLKFNWTVRANKTKLISRFFFCVSLIEFANSVKFCFCSTF